VARWSTKTAISLKRVKIEKKLLWRAYRNSQTLFRTVLFRTPTASCCQRLGFATISGSSKAMDFKFGRYIHRVHPNKSPLKIRRKGNVAYPGTAQNFLSTPIIPGTGNDTNFKFCTRIYRIDRNKNPLKISGKVAAGALRDFRNFSGHAYIGHIARSSFMIFAIAQLSCLLCE